jgi:hypothetical protein
VRTTLDLDEDVLDAARELARARRTSLGSVISALARAGLQPSSVEVIEGLPVIRARSGTQVITSGMVQRAVDDDG